MNRLRGVVKELSESDGLTLVRVDVDHSVLTAIVIDTVETAPYLNIGRPVEAIFKETEAVVALPGCNGISMRNRLAGEVIALDWGKLLVNVSIQCGSDEVHSVITAHAARELNITIGSEVIIMVKTNEVMLSPC